MGRAPDGDARLVPHRDDRRVCGWCLTFSAPKSLSLLWAFGEVRVAGAVREAHDRAVAETLAVLEAQVARARRGQGGRTLVDVEGLIAAGFRHRS
jgi:conjugative relaxase-like TrwC/TraI family protein